MANLSGNAPKDTYQSLLKLESNGMPAGSQAKTVEAGNGDATALQLSDDEVKVTGELNTQGATHLLSTLRVGDNVTLDSAPTDNAELTGLLVDDNGLVVSREFHPNAFDGQDATNSFSTITATGQTSVTTTAPNQTLNLVAGNGINFVTDNGTNKSITIDTTGLFQNPMIIGKYVGDTEVSTTIGKIDLTAVDNTTNDSSFGVKIGSEFSINTANDEITVVNAGIIKIDVTLIVSVITSHSSADVLVKLFQEDAAGNANDIVTINEHLDGLASNVEYRKAIHFSVTRLSVANDTVYVKIKDATPSNSAVSSMVVIDESNIKIERLAS